MKKPHPRRIFATLLLVGSSVAAQSSIRADGVIESSSGGFKFPDGSTQIAAAASLDRVVTVSSSGGDFTSVAAALASIGDAAVDNQYLVQVGPGEYVETDLGAVPSYVHLRGSGQEVTTIVASRSDTSATTDAAVLSLADHATISDLSVRNLGIANSYAIGIYSTLATYESRIERVTVDVDGSGGGFHFAVHLADSQPTIRDSLLRASGATPFGTGVNAAVDIVNISAGFPQPIIVDTVMLGGGLNNAITCTDNTGTGFGLRLTQASPYIRGGRVCGGHRAVAVYTNGNPVFLSTLVQVSSTGGSFLVEVADVGAALFGSSSLWYVGNKFAGSGSIVCANSSSSNFSELETDCDVPP